MIHVVIVCHNPQDSCHPEFLCKLVTFTTHLRVNTELRSEREKNSYQTPQELQEPTPPGAVAPTPVKSHWGDQSMGHNDSEGLNDPSITATRGTDWDLNGGLNDTEGLYDPSTTVPSVSSAGWTHEINLSYTKT